MKETILKLATSIISPFGQRVEMVMIEKNLPFEKVNVNLAEKPDWFVCDSKLGKVPILYAEEQILFESIVICEYLEEKYPQIKLHSDNLLVKAQHRSWMEFSNLLISTLFQMVATDNEAVFSRHKSNIIEKLKIFEQNIKFSPYFYGDNIMLIDICMASFLKPLFFLDNRFNLEIISGFKQFATYAENLLARNSLNKATDPNYEEVLKNFIKHKKSFLLNLSFVL
jgi:glutathione S-transferase